MTETNHHDLLKHALDGMSILTVVGTLVEFLPAVSAILSIVWMCIRIYETETVQKLVHGGEKKDASQES